MKVYFDHPQFLLIALLAVPLLVLGWRAMHGMDVLRKTLGLLMRAALLAALAVMLASPHIAREHHRLTVVGLLDISTSMQRFAKFPVTDDAGARSSLEYLRQWFRAATDLKAPDDQFGLIVFDGRAAAITTPGTNRSLDDAFNITSIEGTNIAEAIRLGLAMMPADTAKRLVLVSDGNETAGSALEAARHLTGPDRAALEVINPRDLRAAVPIDVLPIAYNVSSDVQIVGIEAPAQAQASQVVAVRVVLESTQPAAGYLSLLHEGRYVDLNGDAPGHSAPIELPAGRTVYRAQVQLLDTKVNRFEAVFEPREAHMDVLADNNRAGAFTATPAKGKVLVLDRSAVNNANPIADILREAELETEVVSPAEMPEDLLSMQRYDLVILDNVPAFAMTLDQQAMLARYVNDFGGGLIMLGGEQSFGAGGWNNTHVEDVLPLELNPPREIRLATAALVLVLDKSGSMNYPVAGARASQQEVANEGAALAVESLLETSYVGVVTFDIFAHEHVPLQRNDKPDEIAAQIRAIRADGGTNIMPALRMAHQMLSEVDLEKKRVVCLSDGQSATEGLEDQVRRMKADGIRVTTIAVGDDADFATLARLAEIGEGDFYEVRNPKILPAVLVDSVQIMNKPLLREGEFVPTVMPTGSTLTAGMDSAPPLTGMVITSPKPQPNVAVEMIHPDGEPLLAHWQAGLGRTAAFTSAVHAPWGSAWQDWPNAATLWAQLAREIGRPSNDQQLELNTRIVDDKLVMTLDMLEGNEVDGRAADGVTASARAMTGSAIVEGIVYRPDGSSQKVRLRQSGPHRYEASVPADQPGNYIVALTPRVPQASRRYDDAAGTDEPPGRPTAPIIGGASNTGSPELRRYVSNIGLLRDVAQLTRGRVLDLDDPLAVNIFDRSGLPRSRSILPIWRTILLATVALMLLDVANRRLSWSLAGMAAAGRRFVRHAREARQRGRDIATAVGTLRETGVVTQRRQRPAAGGEAPAEVMFRAEAASPHIERAPQRKVTARMPQKTGPDRRAVEAALEAISGRGAQRRPRPNDDDAPTQSPPPSDGDESPAEKTTSGLLEAKRRARQRERE